MQHDCAKGAGSAQVLPGLARPRNLTPGSPNSTELTARARPKRPNANTARQGVMVSDCHYGESGNGGVVQF